MLIMGFNTCAVLVAELFWLPVLEGGVLFVGGPEGVGLIIGRLVGFDGVGMAGGGSVLVIVGDPVGTNGVGVRVGVSVHCASYFAVQLRAAGVGQLDRVVQFEHVVPPLRV